MLDEISKTINEEIFPKLKEEESLKIFLVGAGRESKKSIREDIRKGLTMMRRYRGWIDIYYPENLFEELLSKGTMYDLLSLENLLADSVHAVLIVLESPGAIAELGAFANHKKLNNRLIVVVDEKHKKDKSFIMLGPVRHLKNETNSKIIFYNPRKPDIHGLVEKIRKTIREVSNEAKVDSSVRNPIVAQLFLLVAIYVMEPVNMEELKIVFQQQVGDVDIILTSALNILITQKEISLIDGTYELTKKGLNRFKKSLETTPERRIIEKSLDKLRVIRLNLTLRGNTSYRRRRGH
ncbi:MAG: retron St85 family effector protein [Chloroflexi bacterium]|nr:retron St85 family effector protein [Chloroflexota bacterium]